MQQRQYGILIGRPTCVVGRWEIGWREGPEHLPRKGPNSDVEHLMQLLDYLVQRAPEVVLPLLHELVPPGRKPSFARRLVGLKL